MRTFLAALTAAAVCALLWTPAASAGPITQLRARVPALQSQSVPVVPVTGLLRYVPVAVCAGDTEHSRCTVGPVGSVLAECESRQGYPASNWVQERCGVESPAAGADCAQLKLESFELEASDTVTCTARVGDITVELSCTPAYYESTRSSYSQHTLKCNAGPVSYEEAYIADPTGTTDTTVLTVGSFKVICRNLLTAPDCAPAP